MKRKVDMYAGLVAAGVLAVVAFADEISGTIRFNPSILHEGVGVASTISETVTDIWRWGGTSASIGTNGSAAGMSKLWVYGGTISGGATQSFDLAGGVTNSFGATLTFARVKMMVLCPSNSMAVAQSVLLRPAPANGFASWQSGTNDGARVFSGGAWAVMAPQTNAYAVTPGTGDLLEIANESTNAATYRLYIGGE
jgi:hypothetical protein